MQKELGLALLLSFTACADDPEAGVARRDLVGFLGSDVAISTTLVQAQDWPAAAVAPDGTTLVVFHDGSPVAADPTDGGDIRGRFLAVDGTPIGGGDFVINTTTARTQSRPDVAVAADGTFLVVWQDASLAPPDTAVSAIRARRLVLLAGIPDFPDVTDFVVNATRATGQTVPAVGAAPDGSFVVVWQDSVHSIDPSGSGVRLRRISAGGLPTGTDRQVNSTTTGNQSQPDIAIAPDGSYVVVFTDASGSDDTSSTGVRARRFDAADAALGPDALVNGTTDGAQKDPAIAVDDAGSFAVAWNDGSSAGDGAPSGIRARRLSTAGAPVGGDVQVNSTTAGVQSLPAVAFDAASGSFVMAWTDASAAAPDTSGSAIRARRLLADDTFDAPDTVVNTTVAGAQTQPALPPRAGTALLVAWASPDGSSRGVRGRVLLVGCPPATGTDFYADPVADRTGMPAPTGVRSPAVCAFPTMTQALAAASAAAATAGVSARAVASDDSGTGAGPVVFAGETFPWLVPGRVVVTTTDDPALGGAGLDPAGFEVLVDDHAGSGPASVRLLGAATRVTAGGALRGLTLSESCAGCPSVGIRVDGYGAPSTPRLDAVEVNAGIAWLTGVEVRGDGVLRDLGASGFPGHGLHVVNDAGANALDRVVVSGGQLDGNVIGVLVSGGTVDIDGLTVSGSPVMPDGSGGDGLVIRDWRLAPSGSTLITPTTLAISALVSDGNADDGVLVDLVDPASTAGLDAITSSGNGGDGVDVRGAPHADAPLDGISNLTEYGFTLSASSITGNGGHGVSLGDPGQTHAIAAFIGGLSAVNDISSNAGAGLRMRQSAGVGPCPSDGVTACTGATIANNVIHENGESGLELETALLLPLYVPPFVELGLGFVQNSVFHNAMAGAGCTVEQTAPQIFVRGPTAMDPGLCQAQATQEECEAQSSGPVNNHCVWTGFGCSVAWDLRGDTEPSCPNGLRSSIFAYNISDSANVISVGLRAENLSIVLADHNEWGHSTSSQNATQGAGSFVKVDLTCGTLGCSF